MAVSLQNLPNELIVRILSFLDRRSLAQVRLVNAKLESIAVEKLFERVRLYAQWKKKDEEDEQEKKWLRWWTREGRLYGYYDVEEQEFQRRYRNDGYDEVDFGPVGEEDYEERMKAKRGEMTRKLMMASEEDARCRADGNEAPILEFNDVSSPGGSRASNLGFDDALFERFLDESTSSLPPPPPPPPPPGRGFLNYGLSEEDVKESGGSEEEEASDGELRQRRTQVKSSSTASDDQWLSDWYGNARYEKPVSRSKRDVSSRPISTSGAEIVSQSDHWKESQYTNVLRRRHWGHQGEPVPEWASEGFPGPPYDAQVFKNILQDASLSKYVKEVHVYTCKADCDLHPKYASEWYRMYNGQMPRLKFAPVYIECIKKLSSFPNLHSLTVHFDRHSAGDGTFEEVILQKMEFQLLWLSRFLDQVNPQKITDLCIRHYDNTTGLKDKLPEFIRSTARLKSLRLSVKHVQTYQNSVYRATDIHSFWERFPGFILEPKRQDLTTLVLYSDVPLGWFPKLDLRGIHFPALRALSLGQHIFHDNRQVDWIISHEKTLEEINLDNCSILYNIGHSITGWLDQDGYPRKDGPDGWLYGWSTGTHDMNQGARKDQFVSISLRWHAIFSQFLEHLSLQEFRFGTSKQWVMKTDSRDFTRGEVGGHPIMPWEDEKNIENEILESRYMIFDDFQQEYRQKWMTKRNARALEHGYSAEDECGNRRLEYEHAKKMASLEGYPDCKEADQAALQALLGRIKGR